MTPARDPRQDFLRGIWESFGEIIERYLRGLWRRDHGGGIHLRFSFLAKQLSSLIFVSLLVFIIDVRLFVYVFLSIWDGCRTLYSIWAPSGSLLMP